MTRDRAYLILDKYIKNVSLKNHMILSAFILDALAEDINENKDDWFIAGLLHDIDLEQVNYADTNHGTLGAQLLKSEGLLNDNVLNAIIRHNYERNSSEVRKDKLDFALSSGESAAGLILAMAYILPDKKFSNIKTKSLVKRMKEKAFAKNVSRECILECEKIGFDISSFFEIALRGAVRANIDLIN